MCEDSAWRILREGYYLSPAEGEGGRGVKIFDEFGRVSTKIFPDPPKAL